MHSLAAEKRLRDSLAAMADSIVMAAELARQSDELEVACLVALATSGWTKTEGPSVEELVSAMESLLDQEEEFYFSKAVAAACWSVVRARGVIMRAPPAPTCSISAEQERANLAPTESEVLADTLLARICTPEHLRE